MSYSNLYKAGWVMVNGNPRMIDTNKLVESRLKGVTGAKGADDGGSPGEEGFSAGLEMEAVDALLAQDGRNVLKSASLKEKEEIDKEIEKAREELVQVRMQADQMMKEASVQIEVMRKDTLKKAQDEGYQEGYDRGMAETEALKAEYLSRKDELEREYEDRYRELEPKFIESLTGIYEHIFKVDLSAYGEIVSNLLIDAMQRIDNIRNYIVHVSKKDFAKVSGEKERILEETGTLADNLEIVSDMTLSPSQCMIETEGGVYDCSLGTELEELKRKLRLLSYK